MNIGKLDKQITVQSRSTTKDAYGQELNTWVDIGTVWANVRYIGGREKMRSSVEEISLDVTIMVRYTTQLMPPKLSDGWRIVYTTRESTRYFKIVGSRDLDERRRFIIFDCVEGSEVQS